ncbi:endonuclease/exonuclease/phosphatase family protein [Arenibacter sp. BSSL-BM3]|uniref:Endonuclease/exonuclease/phosphatase family protein n=1 Tax=Arenibacter arenosicollis TaxID=2762274 RepID=A0ABR7QRY9_9FLAO|nr:endonuclease/exonuclease/phosphatase family protein [Arenibacter arenosicollis]MBC8769844.1 endonuclease/exonuclease/phosphatase family protein [Arenibacter arenosicollis]
MLITYYIISALVISASILPFITHQHWMFRVWEFGRIQVTIIQLVTLIIGILLIENKSVLFWSTMLLHAGLLINHLTILIPYSNLYSTKKLDHIPKHTQLISIVSVNVYQFNERYEELIKLVLDVKPDILLTMESNQAWEDAMSVIENEYTNFKKVALENTYGIHFYTTLTALSMKVNYFIADDLPSIEASLQTDEGIQFTFFGVHPPPPSPTEEDNSRERDGELLSLARRVKETVGPVIVVGDFNNVAWAKSSILFRKTSELIDPRIGRGFVSTFHAKYRFLRFPIDLFFHSSEIFVEDFKTLRKIGSDHLPLFCEFFINKKDDVQEEDVETLEEGEMKEVEEMIEDGIKEESDRPEVAKE